MARSRDIEYKVGFTGDTSQLEAAIKKATDSLTKLGTSPEALRKGIDGAARSALELSQHLNTAFNQDTGKLDLIKFQQSLKASGKSIQDYAASLQSLGPQGEQAFLEVASAISKAELPLRRTNNLIKQFGVTLWNTARWRITTGAINAIVGGIQQAIGYAKSLDSSLNNIRIVTGKSAEEMAVFAKEANAAAKTLSTTTTSYTDASLIYYQQGLDTEQVRQRTEATIKMANVTGQSAETISSQMTAIWENFDNGSRSLESFGDAMVALGASTAASSKEIAEGLQKFAPIAETVGLSFDYASAALTTIVANTRESASVAGTALKTLFSRLEGLKLGDTLEDGTDLNKYSNALMAVGINIKDVSGNLKDMDTILDELGAKWQTLAKDQQMALAETVGGVRQYAQLVALMDNWGDFQKNLVTAQTSEGALQKQADIYAESWEAARKRVKAATEDIYDSFINADQFIKLDNIFTPLLTGIASAVDALGGLTGMLPLVVLLMNNAFGDKIAQSLRDMAVNIGLMTGAEQKRARALQDTVSTLAEDLQINYEENSAVGTRVQLLQEEVTLQAEINNNIDSMSAAQKAVLDDDIKIANVLKEQAITAADQLEIARELTQERQNAIIATSSARDVNNKTLFGNTNIFGASNVFGTAGSIFDTSTINLATDLENVTIRLAEKLQEVVDVSTKASNLSKVFQNVAGGTEEARKAAEELLSTYNMPLKGGGVTEIQAKLKQLQSDATNARTALRTALENLHVDPKDINALIMAVQKLTGASSDAATKMDAATNAMERAGGVARASSSYYTDWAEKIVSIGTAASKTAMALRALSNLGDLFSEDNNQSSIEKLSTALMSFGMLAPTIVPGFKAITGEIKNFKEIGRLNTEITELKAGVEAATAASSSARVATEAAQGVLNNAEQSLEKYSKRQKIVISTLKKKQQAVDAASNAVTAASQKETAALAAEGKAQDALRAKTEALTKAQEASNAARLASIGAIVAVIAVVALLVRHLQKQKEEEEKALQSKLESAEASQKELEANQNLIDAYNKSLTTLDDTAESKEQLKQAALELASAYNIEGSALANLTGNYSQFNEIVKQKRIAELNSAKEDTSNYISAKYADDAKFSSGNYVDINDETLSSFIDEFSPFIDEFQKISLQTLQGNTLEETLNNITTVRERIDEVFGSDSDLSIEIRKFLTDAAEQIRQLGTINAELELQTNKFENFGEYSNWTQTYSTKLQSYGLSESESRGVIQTATANAGLDDYARIYEIQTDILNKFEKYPALAEKVKEKFKDIEAEGADLAAYMPWSAVNYKDFDYLIAKTKEYTDALQSGSTAAINMTNAQKLLNQISSGFKAKDLKDFEQLLGSDKLKEFLQMSQEDQTAYLNNYIDTQFEQQQQQYEIQINALTELQNIADQAAQEAKERLNLSEDDLDNLRKEYQVEETNWALALTEMDSFLSKKKQEKESGKKKGEIKEAIEGLEDDFRAGLENAGITDEQLIDALLKLEDPEKAKEKIKEYFLKAFEGLDPEGDLASYFQAQAESTSYGDQIQKTTWAQESEYLAREANARATAEQVKNLGELNKLQREGTVRGKAYEAGILKLAKTLPQAAAKLKEYNEAVQKGAAGEQDRIRLMRELADIVDADAWGKAIGKIKEANKNLEAAGLKLGEITDSTDLDKYGKELGAMAEAIREVTGASDNQVNESWVQQHFEQIQQVINGDVQTVQSAVGSIRLALYASSEDFTSYASSIGISANNIQNIVSALDGIEFDIDGYADMSAVISNLLAAGATATQVADLLKYIGNAQVGFDVTGVPTDLKDVSAFVDLDTGLMDTKGYLDQLRKLDTVKLQANTNIKDIPSYTGGGGGGGGGKKDTKDLKKDLKDIEERYHEINRKLEHQDRLLTKLDKQTNRTYGVGRLKLFDQQLTEVGKKIEFLGEKNKEAMGYLYEDKQVLQGLTTDDNLNVKLFEGFDVKFTEGQEIENYKDVLQQIVDAYNSFVNDYDQVMKNGTEKEKEEYEALKEVEDKKYEARIEAVKKYEDSLDQVNTLYHQIADERRKEEDLKLDKITYKMELVLDIREAKKQINDFSKTIEESFGDALTHTTKALPFDEANAQIEMNMYHRYVEEYMELHSRLEEANEFTDTTAIIEEMKTLESNIIESGEALLDWLDTVENMYTEALDAAAERFDWFVDHIAHDTEVLGMIKELYTLQGVTYKTQAGFEKIQKATEGQYQGYLKQAQLNKDWYEDRSKELAKAEERLASVEETDVLYDTYKKERDALLEESNRTYQAMLEYAKSAMESAKQMYLDEIEKLNYELEQQLTENIGFDLLEEKYDHFLEETDRYLDPIEEDLETASWQMKLQNDINKTSNNLYKQRLKDLQEEINLRRENNTLSQYDLDILEARYRVLQATMDLEDSRNNKNQLRLVRDSNGNWNYQYTANPNDVATKEEELLKAKKDEWEIEINQAKEYADQIARLPRELENALDQINKEETLTDKEREERIAETVRYYTKKRIDLQNLLEEVTTDMPKTAVESDVLAAGFSESVFNTSSETIQEIVRALRDKGGPKLIATAGTLFENLQEVLKNDLADKFGNTSEEVQQHIKDIVAGENNEGTLEWMTKGFMTNIANIVEIVERNFLPAIESYVPRANEVFEDFSTTIKNTADIIGVDPDNLMKMTQNLTLNIDSLYNKGKDATEMMQKQLTEVANLRDKYLELASAIMDAVRNMETLARTKVASDIVTTAGVALDKTNLEYDPKRDYAEDMWRAVKSNDSIELDYYSQLRDAKIKGENLTKDDYVINTNEFANLLTRAVAEGYANSIDERRQKGEKFLTILDDIFGNIFTGATGGYTGNFDGGKIGILHEKELLLNASDTRNILEAVHIMRGISDTVFNGIANSLNSAGAASMALLGSHLGGTPAVAAGGSLEQHVTIEQVNFPGVTSSREIEEAFENLVNDAAQWIQRRKS